MKQKLTVLTIACVLGLFISGEALAAPAMICPDEAGNAAPQANAKANTNTKPTLNASKGQSYYQSQLTKYTHPISHTQAGLDSVYSTTAINLGLVYEEGEGVWKKYPGAAELFNKWGLDGTSSGNNADHEAVYAMMNLSQYYPKEIYPDSVLRADLIIQDWVDYRAWMKTVPKKEKLVAAEYKYECYKFKICS